VLEQALRSHRDLRPTRNDPRTRQAAGVGAAGESWGSVLVGVGVLELLEHKQLPLEVDNALLVLLALLALATTGSTSATRISRAAMITSSASSPSYRSSGVMCPASLRRGSSPATR
jgi:hypothetical protein